MAAARGRRRDIRRCDAGAATHVTHPLRAAGAPVAATERAGATNGGASYARRHEHTALFLHQFQF